MEGYGGLGKATEGLGNFLRLPLPSFAFPSFLSLSVAFFGCSRGPFFGSSSEEITQEIEGVSMTQTDAGEKLWSLQSPYVQIHEEKQLAELQLPKMNFYKDNHLVSKAEAQTGAIHTETKEVTLSTA